MTGTKNERASDDGTLKLDAQALSFACQAAAIEAARQDGIELSPAGYRKGASDRPEQQALFEAYLGAGIRAYLSALPSSPVSDLVERLLKVADSERKYGFDDTEAALREAASTLTTLTTRNAELEREVKRLRELLQEIEDSTDLTTVNGHLYDRVIAALSTSPQGADHE